MLLPSESVLAGLRAEFGRLQLADGEASAVQSIGLALRLLAQRERGGAGAVRAQVDRLIERFGAAVAPVASNQALSSPIQALLAKLDRVAVSGLGEGEVEWREVLADVESMSIRIASCAELDAVTRTRIGLDLNAWECDDLQAPLAQADLAQARQYSDVTAETLAAYLQDRFDDPGLAVTTFKPLSGGFGKQTFLFGARGTHLNGDFVMRRDLAEPVVDNDCHRVATEFLMIRAAHAHGFPAPEAVWVDSRHALLPGGDFLVMRRAPGVPGGSIFQAKDGIPANLAQTLAEILARLHALPPMPELAELSDSINTARWDLPLDRCVRSYLEAYRALFQRELHLPSPALASLFGWLLEHVPVVAGPPVLLHGDIGFHNFLFDQGHLSAVLDWEFAHLGDPAEDLAYVRNTLGPALDWPAFLAAYQAAGGAAVSAERLHFFQVWGHVRNACASNLIAAKFAAGRVDDLKLVLLPHAYIPQFLRAAQTLIEEGP